jgi:hypothetical protein
MDNKRKKEVPYRASLFSMCMAHVDLGNNYFGKRQPVLVQVLMCSEDKVCSILKILRSRHNGRCEAVTIPIPEIGNPSAPGMPHVSAFLQILDDVVE